MDDPTTGPNNNSADCIIQDGVQCPRTPPWHPMVSKVTGLPFALIAGLGIYILYNGAMTTLLIWLFVFAIFSYPLRYLVCARCPYYGMDCSSTFGKLVVKMFKKQEGKSMLVGLWLDVLFFAFLFAYPLPDIWRIKGFLFVLAWLAAFFLAFTVLTRMACSSCPFTFCPIGKGGRSFWGLLNK